MRKAHDNGGAYPADGNEEFFKKWENTIEVVSNESEKSMPRMEVFYGNEDFKLNYTLLEGRIFVNNEQY